MWGYASSGAEQNILLLQCGLDGKGKAGFVVIITSLHRVVFVAFLRTSIPVTLYYDEFFHLVLTFSVHLLLNPTATGSFRLTLLPNNNN